MGFSDKVDTSEEGVEKYRKRRFLKGAISIAKEDPTHVCCFHSSLRVMKIR